MVTSLRLVEFKNFADETLRVGPFTVIVKAAAGMPLEFRLDVTLGAAASDVDSETVEVDRQTARRGQPGPAAATLSDV